MDGCVGLGVSIPLLSLSGTRYMRAHRASRAGAFNIWRRTITVCNGDGVEHI